MTAALMVNSSSSTLTSTSSAAPQSDESCYYCSHIKLLRDVIPPKRCDYCRVWKCQFCTLKFPLINVKKKVLPKIMKGNSRICVQCFSQHWQENGLSSTSQPAKRSKRSSSVDLDARESFAIDSSRPISFIFDSGQSRDSLTFDSNRRESMAIDSMWAGKDSFDESTRLSFMNTPDEKEAARLSYRSRSRSSSAALEPVAEDVQTAQSLISAVDLWISIFAATILVVIVVLEGYSLQQRVCYCVATYGVFLTLHPWFHKPQSTAAPERTKTQNQTLAKANSGIANQTTTNAASQTIPRMPSVAEGEEPRVLGAFPESYRRQKAEMAKSLKYYLSDECPWKVIKTTSGGIVSEMTANDTPFPLFKIELFITGAPMTKFVDFLDSKDVKDRGLWDLNVANFAMIETFPEEPNVSVCHNTQKSFLGGLVAARDFCLLYVREGNCISFSSVKHPRVPVSPNATRGNVLLSCFHCHEAIGEDGTPGFILTYLCQVDIGGSLPSKLLYNGSIDNMVKMIKVFKSPKKLLR